MEKEFNLSEKRNHNTDVGGPDLGYVYWEKDVKEFIKKLEELLKGPYPKGLILKELNKLAGDKLI